MVEALLATLVMVSVIGSIFGLLDQSTRAFGTQPETSDVQQRLRVAISSLQQDLAMAGAGAYAGATSGGLSSSIAPVMPYRSGATNPDPPGTFRRDSITVLCVPPIAAHTTIVRTRVDSGPATVVDTRADCGGAREDRWCGFEEGMRVLLAEPGGRWDVATVVQVQEDALHLLHPAPLSSEYDGGDAVVTQLTTDSYYLATNRLDGTHQLMHYDGAQTDMPAVDNVVKLEFRYFAPGPLELTAATLTDGPWRPDPAHTNRYDADLLQVRRIRVTLRVQAAVAWFRGPASSLFMHPGTAAPSRFVPDQELTFDVSPRNMNLGR